MSWAVLAVRFWESFERDCYTHHTRSIRDNQINMSAQRKVVRLVACLTF